MSIPKINITNLEDKEEIKDSWCDPDCPRQVFGTYSKLPNKRTCAFIFYYDS